MEDDGIEGGKNNTVSTGRVKEDEETISVEGKGRWKRRWEGKLKLK